jgi:DNA-binding MarR family transcriptional regulator
LNCSHAVICEEYSDTSQKIVFEGCWKIDDIKTPVDRENCDKFEEDPQRVKRSFWKKWEGCIYIASGGQENEINYEAFSTARDLLTAEHERAGIPGPAVEHEQTGEGEPLPGLEEPETPRYIHELPDLTADIPESDSNCASEQSDSNYARPGPEINTRTTRSLVLQALAHNISRLSEIAEFAGVHPSTAHYHLSSFIKSGAVKKSGYGTYVLRDSGSKSSDQDLKTFEKSGYTSSQRFELLKTSMGELLKIVVEETLNGNPNITNKLLADITGLSKSYVNRLCVKLEEKELIERKNLGMFIHNEATIHAVKLLTTPSTLHAVEVTPCEQNLNPSKSLEVRPNNIRFKVQVLEGDPAPHWKEVPMRSWIARWCHDYECPVQFTPSHAVIYIPAFNTENLFFSFYEAYKRAKAVLQALEHDHNYKFGEIEMIAAHNAIVNDPLALLAEFDGVVQDKDKRLQLDRSCGFKELEAIQTHICEEDIIKILNLIYNPVIKGEYNPWELLKGIQKTQLMFDQNLKDHLKLVSALRESGEALRESAKTIKDVTQTMKEEINRFSVRGLFSGLFRRGHK